MTPELRQRISAANKGRPQHPNQVAALRACHLGAKRTPEACANIRAGKAAAAAQRKAISEIATLFE